MSDVGDDEFGRPRGEIPEWLSRGGSVVARRAKPRRVSSGASHVASVGAAARGV